MKLSIRISVLENKDRADVTVLLLLLPIFIKRKPNLPSSQATLEEDSSVSINGLAQLVSVQLKILCCPAVLICGPRYLGRWPQVSPKDFIHFSHSLLEES